MTLKPWFILVLVVVSIAMMSLQFAIDLDAPAALWALTPIYAAGLMFGSRLSLAQGVALVIGTRLAGGSIIGWLTGRWDYAFYGWGQVVNLLAFASTVFVGKALLAKRRTRLADRLLAGGASAIAFFLISNFGSWALPPTETPMYSKDLSGLLHCYVMAIPFMKLTAIACVGYTVVMFSDPVLEIVTEDDPESSPAVANSVVS